ncbi:MAG TPA: translocation/assembly module TamB domain-containing protein, partial [Candidatus Binatia bacterium]|nr:translocation/assembly module TamB domain-containing protein [Candidatus Binatia bacterium]
LDGALSGALGSADWRGRVRFAQAPSYEFDLAVITLDLNKLSADARAPRGAVSFKGKVQGSVPSLDKMTVRANLEVLPSTVGAVQVRGGDLDAAYGDGRIRIARASLRSADSTITVKGDLGTALDQQGKLTYDVRSENLTPWLALVGRKGAGALTLTGSAQGGLAELTTRGLMKAARLQLDGFSAGSVAVDFDLARKRGQAIPTGNIVARLADLKAGAELQKLDATIKLLPQREMQIEARAQDSFSREHRFKGSLDYGAPDKVARVNQLSLSLPDGNWNLAQPATLTQRGETFWVERFTLRNQERQATLDGQVSLRGTQALNLTADRVPLESLAAFLPEQAKMTGLISLHAKVGGSAAAPLIGAVLKLTDSTLGGQKYQGLVAEVNYRERQADVNLTLQQDSNHSLNATGKLPLLLSWQDGWRSEVTGALDLRIKSAGLSLAFLNAYAAKAVRDIGGDVSLDVTARGALLEPRWSGSLRLAGGKLKLTALNVDLTEIGTAVSFDQRRLTIADFSARAGEGRLAGSGALSLKQYQIENFKFALEARRWPAIQTRRYQAQIGGNVELTGSLSAPKLAGRVDIIEANLRPDLASLTQSSTPVKRDETIVVVNRDGIRRAETTPNNANNGQGDAELFKKLALDLDVRMPRNVWVRHPDAVAELRGQVRATKISGQELQLVGLAEIVRGWAAFQGRRFDFVRGDIRFIGGAKVDPTLDIVAQHRLPQYTVDALVGGTAEKPSLVLRSDPALDQSDILALLVFGKTTKDLGRGEQLSLKQNALDISSGFAAAKIGSAVAEAIGLDALGFDLGDFDFSGGRIGYGRYIGRRTYVTLSQELAGERGQKASVEYQFSRDWKIESSTTSDGTSGIDVIWHKRY